MRRFNEVAKFSETTADANKLITMMEDYARTDINERMKKNLLVDGKYSKLEKAQKIQEVYLAELERRSKVTLADVDGDVQMYSSIDIVAKMQAMLNKVMVDTVLPIYINETGLSLLAEFHFGGYGDTFSFEMKDASAYDVSRMGARQKHTKTQERKKTNKTIATDFYGLTTISTLPQYMLGEAMVADDMILSALSINKKIYTLVVKKFISITAGITDTDLIATGYTENGLLEKLRTGSAKNGSPMVIVGDAVALKTVLPASANTQIFLQDEFNTTLGYMSTFNTYKAMAFDVVADENEASGVLGLPTNKVYGIPVDGTKLIHVAIGATMANTDEYFDNNNLSSLATLRKEIGVDVATNRKVVRCDFN